MQDRNCERACQAYQRESSWPADPDAMTAALRAATAAQGAGPITDKVVDVACQAYAQVIKRDANRYAMKWALKAAERQADMDRPLAFEPASVLAHAQPLAFDMLSLVGPSSDPIAPRAEMAIAIVELLVRDAGNDLRLNRPSFSERQGLEIALGAVLGLIVPLGSMEAAHPRAIAVPRVPEARESIEGFMPQIRERVSDHARELSGESRAAMQFYAAAIILIALAQGFEKAQGLTVADSQALAVHLLAMRAFPGVTGCTSLLH